MALAGLEEFRRLLACPRCRSALADEPDGFRCASPDCSFHSQSAFPVVGRWPVLVDFETSVLRREDVVPRGPRDAEGPLIERLPKRLRALWKPLNRVAAGNADRLLRMLPGPTPLVLVVGGATVGNGVAALYTDPQVQVIAFDLHGSENTQLIADAHRIPLAAASVDAVLVQAVLEHVLEPTAVVAEIHRVLADDGLVYAETPFLQQVHAGAYDFTRYTASGHRYLFRRFSEIDAGAVAGPGTQLLWSIEHIVRGLFRSAIAGKLVRAMLFWLRNLDAAVPASHQSDNASAYYFLGRKRQRDLTPHEIVRYYRGAG
ncbi:MAG TPA: class I SAM-dependent methyltransferase [Actinophytocola sp.]|jgi:SAM-dependent methyltransferase|uniref:class I SAM-dependent methyltransferase n=1 Tax=Actinophytocola sp. TaxID=1872138 RepID=UPI002E0335C6|nr:class I SAM-dependent methyltransferase [Actinophytocola sp.]